MDRMLLHWKEYLNCYKEYQVDKNMAFSSQNTSTIILPQFIHARYMEINAKKNHGARRNTGLHSAYTGLCLRSS